MSSCISGFSLYSFNIILASARSCSLFFLASFSVEFQLSEWDEAYMLASYFTDKKWDKKKLDAYKVIYRALCAQWFEENL